PDPLSLQEQMAAVDRERAPVPLNTKPPPLPDYVEGKLKAWRSIFIINVMWRSIFATTAIVCSGFAASQLLGSLWSSLLALIAPLSTSLMVLHQNQEMGSAYKAAWRVLDKAVGDFNKEPNESTCGALYDAIEKGEELIRVVDK